MTEVGDMFPGVLPLGRRRHLSGWALAGLVLSTLALSPAHAQPTQLCDPRSPLTLVVPYAAGGSADAVARTLSHALSAELNCPVVVHNRPGGSGSIGMTALSRAPPDGRVVGMGTVSTLAVLPAARGGLAYSLHSFAPIGLVASAPAAVIVPAAMHVESLAQFVTLARARPGELNFGSVGDGSVVHLAGQMFMAAANVDLTHVPYTSMAKLLPDLLAGRIHVLVDQLGAVPAGYLESGALRVLAMLAPRAPDQMPAFPTSAQAGVPGLDVRMWSGLLAPAGTPAAVVEQLNAALNAALRQPRLQAAFAGLGMQQGSGSARDFGELIRREQFAWRAAAEAAHWDMLTSAEEQQPQLNKETR